MKNRNFLNFSVAPYYFAEKMHKDLNIPVGIIHNAVPCSPNEFWMTKNSILTDEEIEDFKEFIPGYCRKQFDIRIFGE